jgi:hypothetical protein
MLARALAMVLITLLATAAATVVDGLGSASAPPTRCRRPTSIGGTANPEAAAASMAMPSLRKALVEKKPVPFRADRESYRGPRGTPFGPTGCPRRVHAGMYHAEGTRFLPMRFPPRPSAAARPMPDWEHFVQGARTEEAQLKRR